MSQYLRAIVSNCKIKRLAFSPKEKAHIRDNTTAGHWIKDKITGFCEIEECVRNELGRYPPGPVVSESFITFVEIPLISGAKSPPKLFEFFLARFSL